jgi:hypothetical protein
VNQKSEFSKPWQVNRKCSGVMAVAYYHRDYAILLYPLKRHIHGFANQPSAWQVVPIPCQTAAAVMYNCQIPGSSHSARTERIQIPWSKCKPVRCMPHAVRQQQRIRHASSHAAVHTARHK